LIPVDAEEPVAVIIYPGDWFTVTEPPELVCRYFNPESIPSPADPATLDTAVRVDHTAGAFADAVTDATDPALWDVIRQENLTVDGRAATLIEGTALEDGEGIDAGVTRFLILIDYGDEGVVGLWTTGPLGDRAYVARVALVTLMTMLSVFQAPTPA
jgi:hypothetical protein